MDEVEYLLESSLVILNVNKKLLHKLMLELKLYLLHKLRRELTLALKKKLKKWSKISWRIERLFYLK